MNEITDNLYDIYGLRLQSNRPIPFVVEARDSTPTDCEIYLQLEDTASPSRDVDRPLSGLNIDESSDEQRYNFWFTGDGRLDFHLNLMADRVTAVWQNSSIPEVTSLLLGPVLSSTLRLKGQLALHGCCVVIDGKAIAILGETGAGKSTFAAYCASVGHPIISDDVVTMKQTGSIFCVQPGYPRLRLWPSALPIFDNLPEEVVDIFYHIDKKFLPLEIDGKDGQPWCFHSNSAPLDAIYILGKRVPNQREPKITSLPTKEAVPIMMQHRSVNIYDFGAAMNVREFAQLSVLAKSIPVKKIDFGDDVSRIDQNLEALRRDLEVTSTEG